MNGHARLAAVVPLLFVGLAGCGTQSTSDPDASATPDGGFDAAVVVCSADEACDDGRFCNGSERCDPDSAAASDDGCVPATAPCPADECDEASDRCVADCADPDRDGDGVNATACGGTDCDDDDADRFPGNAEVCDEASHDEDCVVTTVGRLDGDGDGQIAAGCCNLDASGGPVCGADCDDANPAVHRDATEVCNDTDDDCDGVVDERLRLTLWPDADGDGRGDGSAEAMSMLACAESEGWVQQRGDCDDDAPGRHVGATEACNGIDDDCDTLVDDVNPGIVACSSGETIACVNACGVPGTSACRADCLGYATCTAAEACNGCDDDADGAIDDGFECARGTTETCTNRCGVAGTRVCGSSCGWAGACTAIEACNYCDDNGTGGIFDERSLATTDSGVQRLSCGGSDDMFGVASCDAESSGSATNLYASVLDGSAVDTAGAFWFDPNWYVGWGPVRIVVAMEARTTGAGTPLGGWSVVLARGGSANLGSPESLGIPSDVEGVSFSWNWSTFSVFSPFPSPGDSFRYARLGPGGGSRGRALDSTGEDIVDFDADLDAGDGTFVRQTMVIEYDPDDPRTPANEERVVVRVNGGSTTYQVDDDRLTGDPSDDMPVGSPLRIGITAGTFSRTVQGNAFGAPVEARMHLWTFHPPSGPGAPTWDDHATVSRDQICPGL